MKDFAICMGCIIGILLVIVGILAQMFAWGVGWMYIFGMLS